MDISSQVGRVQDLFVGFSLVVWVDKINVSL